MKRNKATVLKKYPNSYCIRLSDGTGYIVWPQRRCPPLGQETVGIGFGKTARNAWKSALETIKTLPSTVERGGES